MCTRTCGGEGSMGGGSGGHRVGRSSACAHPVKPGAPGGLVKHGCTLSSRGGLHWALMAPTRQIPSAGWRRGGLGGVSSPHSSLLVSLLFDLLAPMFSAYLLFQLSFSSLLTSLLSLPPSCSSLFLFPSLLQPASCSLGCSPLSPHLPSLYLNR